MTESDRIRCVARFAGQIKRYHTWPTIHTQTIAEHSYHILRIWSQVWGRPSPEVTLHAIWHDCGEMSTGDVPYPNKLRHPELKEITDHMEVEQLEKYGIELPELDTVDKRRFKITDLLEMFEYCLMETRMGNTYTEPLVHDLGANIVKLIPHDSEQNAVRVYIFSHWGYHLPIKEKV